VPPLAGLTDDRVAVAVRDPGPNAAGAVQQVLLDCHAVGVEQRDEEGRP
jgi:hypothetical protein